MSFLSKNLLARRSVQLFLYLLGFVALFPSAYAFLSFLNAVTREEALRKWGMPLPYGWTAGVWDHSHYYHWWTISEHPFLFGMSATCLFLSLLYLTVGAPLLFRRWKRKYNVTG